MRGSDYECNVTCKSCGQVYHQIQEEQAPGFRMIDEDICPYCGAINRKSMSFEFHNSKVVHNLKPD